MTSEQQSELLIILGRRLLEVDELLLATIELQHAAGKCYALKMPGLSDGERDHFLSIHSQAETKLDQLQASTRDFSNSFEAFIKQH